MSVRSTKRTYGWYTGHHEMKNARTFSIWEDQEAYILQQKISTHWNDCAEPWKLPLPWLVVQPLEYGLWQITTSEFQLLRREDIVSQWKNIMYSFDLWNAQGWIFNAYRTYIICHCPSFDLELKYHDHTAHPQRCLLQQVLAAFIEEHWVQEELRRIHSLLKKNKKSRNWFSSP